MGVYSGVFSGLRGLNLIWIPSLYSGFLELLSCRSQLHILLNIIQVILIVEITFHIQKKFSVFETLARVPIGKQAVCAAVLCPFPGAES